MPGERNFVPSRKTSSISCGPNIQILRPIVSAINTTLLRQTEAICLILLALAWFARTAVAIYSVIIDNVTTAAVVVTELKVCGCQNLWFGQSVVS